MRKYFCNKTIKDSHYEGLKPDQARALYLIAESGAEGLTDAQLATFNADGNPVAEGEKGLKVKTALLATGHLIGETIPSERKGSERTYQFTGVPLTDDLSPSLRTVGEAVRALGTGTKSQFAEQLLRDAEARGETLDADKAAKTVNGVWLRLQDRGIIVPIKKSEVKADNSVAEVEPVEVVDEAVDYENE